MIRVVKETTFDAAHKLPGYEGACQNLHGHTYKLQVGVEGVVKPDGMVIDFKQLNAIVDEAVSHVDHKFLNEVTMRDFPRDQPTAELMVAWFRAFISAELPDGVTVCLVKLWETPTSYAEWRTV